MKESSFALDPRTKMFCMLIINFCGFTTGSRIVMTMTALITLCALFCYTKRKEALFLSALYTAALIFDLFVVAHSTGALNIISVMLACMICRMMPCLIWGYILISKTTVSEFVAAMERMHIPKQIIIPFSVMFRFIPTIKEEYTSIGDAMKMRGISFGKTRGGPVALLEYRLVPLFISCVKIGDELSSSALTRGLGSPVKRTNICKIGFHFQDVIFAAISVVSLCLHFYFKLRGSV